MTKEETNLRLLTIANDLLVRGKREDAKFLYEVLYSLNDKRRFDKEEMRKQAEVILAETKARREAFAEGLKKASELLWVCSTVDCAVAAYPSSQCECPVGSAHPTRNCPQCGHLSHKKYDEVVMHFTDPTSGVPMCGATGHWASTSDPRNNVTCEACRKLMSSSAGERFLADTAPNGKCGRCCDESKGISSSEACICGPEMPCGWCGIGVVNAASIRPKNLDEPDWCYGVNEMGRNRACLRENWPHYPHFVDRELVNDNWVKKASVQPSE